MIIVRKSLYLLIVLAALGGCSSGAPTDVGLQVGDRQLARDASVFPDGGPAADAQPSGLPADLLVLQLRGDAAYTLHVNGEPHDAGKRFGAVIGLRGPPGPPGSNATMVGDGGIQVVPFDGGAVATLKNTGVTAGTYQRATVTVNAQGGVTAASSNNNYGDGGVSVTQFDGGSVTTLKNTAVTAGTFANATVTVGSDGRLTNASANTINYQTIKSNSIAQTVEPALNFSNNFQLSDTPSTSTNVDLNNAITISSTMTAGALTTSSGGTISTTGTVSGGTLSVASTSTSLTSATNTLAATTNQITPVAGTSGTQKPFLLTGAAQQSSSLSEMHAARFNDSQTWTYTVGPGTVTQMRVVRFDAPTITANAGTITTSWVTHLWANTPIATSANSITVNQTVSAAWFEAAGTEATTASNVYEVVVNRANTISNSTWGPGISFAVNASPAIVAGMYKFSDGVLYFGVGDLKSNAPNLMVTRTKIGFFGTQPIVINATSYTLHAGTTSFDLPTGATLTNVEQVLRGLLQRLGNTSGYGLVKADLSVIPLEWVVVHGHIAKGIPGAGSAVAGVVLLLTALAARARRRRR